MRKSHPHESPLDYMQSSHCPPEVGREFHSNSGLVRHRDEAFPETPNQAEVSFHGHRAEQWQQHTALLGGVGSCSTYIWKTNPGRKKKKTTLSFNLPLSVELWKQSSHQEQIHGIEPTQFLRYDGVARRTGIQQGGHQSSYVQACAPKRFLQHTQCSQHGISLKIHPR